MEVNLLYTIYNGETFGIMIATYFYLTGLSAGSFILSTLAYGFGVEKYKPLGKIGVVMATGLLLVAPLFLLLHVGKPLRSWELFVYLNPASPITWGSFLLTLYPINCIIYGWYIFRGNARLTKIFGFIGIPLAICVHGYTGFILSFGKARILWNSPIMPLLFLVSAMVSGIALMILVCIIKDRYFSKEKTINEGMVFELAKIMGWVIVFDIFLVVCDVSVLFVSHREAYEVGDLLISGKFSLWFVGVETLLGKIIPLFLIFYPRTRNIPVLIIACILIVVGIYVMRCNVVIGGEFIPLL